MRIVGGRLGGRTLAGPKSQAIRPTSDRLRGWLFNILGGVGAGVGLGATRHTWQP
jgi:16S rRNA G966 N2-methylase RsmD